jgi:hypothetical protein
MPAPAQVMTRSFGLKTTVAIGTGFRGMSSALAAGSLDKDSCRALVALQASDHALLFLRGNGPDAPERVAAGQPARDVKGVGHVLG